MTRKNHLICAIALAFSTSSPAADDAHVGPITDVAVIDGKIYSCSQGGIFAGIGDRLRLEHRPDFRVFGLASHRFDDSDLASGFLIAGGEPGVSGSVRWRTFAGISVSYQLAKDTVDAIAASPDGRLAAAACVDGKVIVRTFGDSFAAKNWTLLHQHTAAVRAVAFSPDGKWLASAGLDGVVIISPVEGDSFHQPIHLDDHSSGVECLAFSPDSTAIASGSRDSKVRIHQVGEGKLLRTYDGLGMADEPVAGRVPARVLSIAWGKNALVAGTSKATLHRLSERDDRSTEIARVGTDPITALAFHRDDAILLVGARCLSSVELENPPAPGVPEN